jgi:uncharacterized protein (TIGR03067 family)
MKIVALAILIAGLSIAADNLKETAEELKKLEGTWVVESIVRDPREKHADQGKGIRCIIKGENVMVKVPGEEKPAGGLRIKIDPTKMPKAMDVQPEGEKDAIAAIYEVKGDTVRVCGAPHGKARPTAFASEPGSGHTLFVLKRANP